MLRENQIIIIPYQHLNHKNEHLNQLSYLYKSD